MELQARLVHAEPGRRVVQISARDGDRRLGSALGEAADAEQAEERALARLLARLQPAEQWPAAPQPTTSAHPRAERTAPAPAAMPAMATPKPGREPEALEPAMPEGLPAEPPPDPEDWSDELARIDLQRQRIGWSREQEGIYLERAFGHPSRSRLTSWADLKTFLGALEGFAPGLDPASAPVPLRRPDLLIQSDALLGQLGWSTDQARSFLEQHLALSSRRQLSDEQLLQFNLLLETELLCSSPDSSGIAASQTTDRTSTPA
jgi:hypothetical protein